MMFTVVLINDEGTFRFPFDNRDEADEKFYNLCLAQKGYYSCSLLNEDGLWVRQSSYTKDV
jgi:hypothetical protein